MFIELLFRKLESMKVLKYLLPILLFISCESYKKVLTTDNTKKTTITDRKEIKRKGDSLSIVIPNVRYKDTIITRVNYETKTVARVVYDKKGNQRIDCISAEINEKLESIREDIKNDIKTENENNREFKPQYFFYAIGFLGIVIIIMMIVFYVLINKVTKAIERVPFNS
ncbi:MAG: hypothetical protein KGV59_01420 [Tenacibaculum sp.]|nr:hypothetical protein [Tenacibaculum sp.]